MRVAITYHGCHRRGGVERVMLECVNFMAARGHETHALARNWDDEAVSPHVQRQELEYLSPFPAFALPAYRRAVTREVAGIVPPVDVVAGFGAGAPPGAVVWMQSVHRAWIEKARASRPLSGRLRQRINPFHPVALAMERRQLVGREYARLIALTPEVKADINRLYDVPNQDIDVLPNGYSAAEFHPGNAELREAMRARLGFRAEDRVVLFVANELERKGFRPLLQAISSLHDSSVRVLAVGGFRDSEARREVSRLGLDSQVVLTGGTSDVADYYAAADVFALPTKYEAWGLVIVEALASGLPVLTTHLAGASVAVRNGDTGVLVNDPADSSEIANGLHSLLNGHHCTPEQVSASVAEYEWARLLVRYEEILSQVAQT